tara:strand:+ start:254 stop:586 length:333 start_codon:yes stop_codon:yes gene_type:complete
MNKIIKKPWGQEEIIFLSKDYCVKKLTLNKNEMTSLQYHEKKTETVVILKGQLNIQLENKNLILNPFETITIFPNQKHRMSSKDNDCLYLECSTPYLEDVVRIHDKYKRK